MTYGRRYEEMYNNVSGVNFNDILYQFNVSMFFKGRFTRMSLVSISSDHYIWLYS